ncbi:MAG: hypothetical protein HYU25_03610 [Candidatus Rokubacteria bacterium]|nr:hypothetical protein [Candidatus Rokubacteria bacterium]
MRARVTPTLGPVQVSVLWGLVVPPTKSAVEQDLYLLWPGLVDGEMVAGAPDPALSRSVGERGFTVIREGRLPLFARHIYTGGQRPPPEAIEGGAPFVTYVREAGALGRTSPATYIRIPWTPKLVNPTFLMELRMTLVDSIKERRASWLENRIWGRRHTITLSFHDVRSRALFPMYLAHRNRVAHLADDPSQLLINFGDSEHLKIYEVSPPASRRQPSETRKDTEVVSLYLDPSEGLRPQVLAVQFGYFTGWQSWALVVFAALFFVLGNIAGPLIAVLARRVGARLAGRIHFGPRGQAVERQTGTVVPRETLTRIEPGTTTLEEVLRLCGPEPEEHEQLAMPERRILVYRGRKIVPQRRRRLGWLATVSRWDAEHHEVEITLDRGVVQGVQARVRRTHLEKPDGG